MIRAGTVAIADFPKVIEPTAGGIEIQLGETDDQLRWVQFKRLTLLEVEQALGPLPEAAVHIFCSGSLEDDAVLLTYNLHGLLYSFMWKEGARQWTDLPVPPEMVGETDLRPSVRLVFKDDRAKQSFLIYYQQVLAEKAHNPTLQLLFNRLACSPVVLPVATAKDANGS